MYNKTVYDITITTSEDSIHASKWAYTSAKHIYIKVARECGIYI